MDDIGTIKNDIKEIARPLAESKANSWGYATCASVFRSSSRGKPGSKAPGRSSLPPPPTCSKDSAESNHYQKEEPCLNS